MRWGLFYWKKTVLIYLDESGDLGWNFSNPYLKGGSSRFLTLAALLVPPEKASLPERNLRQLYKSQHWSRREKKWSGLSKSGKIAFTKSALALVQKHNNIQYLAIVVKKENVKEHIRKDPNKLYNYMIKLFLLDSIAQQDSVELIPDRRSMKVESGNGLHDYLRYGLLFEKWTETRLTTIPTDSQNCMGLQFADYLAGIVQSHFEFNDSSLFTLLNDKIHLKTLFF